MLLPWLTDGAEDPLLAIKAGAHALLFSGPKGVGKRAIAEHVAALQLCHAPAHGTTCGQCDGCNWLAAGNHPDYIVIEPGADAAENAAEEEGASETAPAAPTAKGKKPSRFILINQIRELLVHLELTAHSGPGRVILIDPAELMQHAAANALLKTLEEPAPRTIFMLVTAAEQKLPVTVRSRCRRVPIGRPPQELGLEWLKQQGVERAEVLLRLAGGAPLRAMNLKDSDLLDRWDKLNQNLTSEGIRRLEWDTTPEALGDLCTVLQMLCVDLQRRQAGAARAYGLDGELDSLAKRIRPEQVADCWRQLGDIVATLQHPLNGALVRDRLLIGFDRLLQGTLVPV